jgi:aminoglycoside phosphotransferase family enzyme
VSNELIAFYQAHRALLRAKAATGHLQDPVPDRIRAKWLARARQYARLAEQYTRTCLAGA